MAHAQWPRVHSTTIPVRWCDMDAFGHVNNSVYLSYFEIARIEWWHAITPADEHFLDVGPVVITANCTFFKAIHYPETLIVTLHVGPPGRSSYDCFYQITSYQDQTLLYAEGNTKIVWVDRKLQKSIPLPEFIKKHLPQSG